MLRKIILISYKNKKAQSILFMSKCDTDILFIYFNRFFCSGC
jgi:hypothetical protein